MTGSTKVKREPARIAAAVMALAWASAASAQLEPLTARVDDTAAQQFARLWQTSGGKPTAAQIEAQYLAGGGTAIEVFTPNRIRNAQWLAKKVEQNPQIYEDAVEKCLPWVAATNDQLRSTYLGLKGLLPNKPLPPIAVVIGANNSGGTAGRGMQVIGLEVICRIAPTRAEFDERMRQFFAHETVHTWQANSGAAALDNPLLAAAFGEGVPDYVTYLVTGQVPGSARNEWARSREPWIWEQFLADAAIVKAGTNAEGQMNEAAQAAFRRWFTNAGDPPEGWPDELGYWVGMRIAQAYVARSADPRAAIERLLNPDSPQAILQESGYGSGLSSEKGEKFTR